MPQKNFFSSYFVSCAGLPRRDWLVVTAAEDLPSWDVPTHWDTVPAL